MRLSPSKVWILPALLLATACAPKGDLASASVAGDPDSFADPIVLAAQTKEARFAEGDVLPVNAEVCLADGETLTVLDADGEHQLSGPGCQLPVRTEAVVEEQPEPEPVEKIDRAVRVISGSDTALERYPVGSELPKTQVCLRNGETLQLRRERTSLTLTGPSCFAGQAILADIRRKQATAKQQQKARQQATRKTFTLMYRPPAKEQFFVYRGSRSALARYPRGTSQSKYKQICLKGSERLTLVSKKGRKVTYGKGCNQRVNTADDDNSGATTIGRLDDWLERATGIGE